MSEVPMYALNCRQGAVAVGLVPGPKEGNLPCMYSITAKNLTDVFSSDTIYLLISFRKSTLSQNRQLDILIGDSQQ